MGQGRKSHRIIHAYGGTYLKFSSAVAALLLALIFGIAIGTWVTIMAVKPLSRLTKPPHTESDLSTVKEKPVTQERRTNADPEKNQNEVLTTFISNRYGTDLASAQQFVRYTKSASDKSGIDQITLLAIIAKESSFTSVPPVSGWLKIRPLAHPKQEEEVKAIGLDGTSLEGQILLGALLLESYREESMGNIDLALQKFHGASNDLAMGYANSIHQIEDGFQKATSTPTVSN